MRIRRLTSIMDSVWRRRRWASSHETFLAGVSNGFKMARRALLVELITCRALGLMWLAHSALSWSISSARTHALNRITFTYYATSIPRFDLRVVLRVTGEPTGSDRIE